MADDFADATLELTILSANGLKDSNFLGKSRPFAVAWVDPCFKKSTKGLLTPSRSSGSSEPKLHLHLPLSPRALRNPSSCLTVQIFSPRLPFRAANLVGTAVLPLSSLRLGGETLTLPLHRPSGRAHGSLRVSLRILWCLGAAPAVAGISTAAFTPVEVYGHSILPVHPTAPPMPYGQRAESEVLEEDPSSLPIEPTASPMPDCHVVVSGNLAVPGVSEVVEGPNLVFLTTPAVPDVHSVVSGNLAAPGVSEVVGGRNLVAVNVTAPAVPDKHNAWRSFLIGLVSGTVATVLVGAAELSED